MARLVWGAFGARHYENGVDRGVLYVGSNPGVPWNGLRAVSESPSGGEARPYYIDGIKYLNLSTAEEYAATIEAFSSPAEFAPCDGTLALQNGLFVTQQPRKQFGFSYRTLLGNDSEGSEFGYKLHLVYNALASTASRMHSTLSDASNPTILSWPITTTPPFAVGYRPTAHLIIDSRYTPGALMGLIEDTLYGTDAHQARLPSISEIKALAPVIFSDDFNRPDSTTVGNGWIRYNPEDGGGIVDGTLAVVDDHYDWFERQITLPSEWTISWTVASTAPSVDREDAIELELHVGTEATRWPIGRVGFARESGPTGEWGAWVTIDYDSTDVVLSGPITVGDLLSVSKNTSGVSLSINGTTVLTKTSPVLPTINSIGLVLTGTGTGTQLSIDNFTISGM